MKLRNKKTGEIGYFCFANWDDPVLIIMDKNGVQLAKYTSLAELNEGWEDYEDPKEYWCIDWTEPGIYRTVYEDERDDFNKEIGNYFETREEAEKAVEKLKAWKRLKDKGFRFDRVIDDVHCIRIEGGFHSDKPAWKLDVQPDLDFIFGGEE